MSASCEPSGGQESCSEAAKLGPCNCCCSCGGGGASGGGCSEGVSGEEGVAVARACMPLRHGQGILSPECGTEERRCRELRCGRATIEA
eukprot:535785-Pelagomonas_calceolata.AAC.1